MKTVICLKSEDIKTEKLGKNLIINPTDSVSISLTPEAMNCLYRDFVKLYPVIGNPFIDENNEKFYKEEE